ncbi:MAG TPA: hypothetical protein VF902_07060 [Coriobacteriia bacterium]
MSIDGRQIGKPPDREPHEGAGVRVVAVLIVVVPLLALVALAYWVGTMTGGVLGGVLSVGSTAATVGVLWLLARRRRR